MGNRLLPHAPSQARPMRLVDGLVSGSHPTLRTGLLALQGLSGQPTRQQYKRKKECQGQVWNQKEDSFDFRRPLPTPKVLSSTGVAYGAEFSAPSGSALLRTLQFFPAGCCFSSPPILVSPFPPGPQSIYLQSPRTS